MCVLGAGAGASRRWAEPEDPAGGGAARAGRALALAAALRALVVTTGPLDVKLLLRDGGDSSLLDWW
jgi:hypothetical protein